MIQYVTVLLSNLELQNTDKIFFLENITLGYVPLLLRMCDLFDGKIILQFMIFVAFTNMHFRSSYQLKNVNVHITKQLF